MSGSLVLASRSPARARLLTEAGVTFSVQPTAVDEAALKAQAVAQGIGPRGIAQRLALAKAEAHPAQSDQLMLGADQTLEFEGRLFDKPASLDAARDQLRTLRGRSHQLHSAVALVGRCAASWSAVQTVSLQVRDFSDGFLEDYLAVEGEALLGCVGAYRLEGLGAQLFERVDGDYFAVLGLPLLPLLEHLRDRGLLAR